MAVLGIQQLSKLEQTALQKRLTGLAGSIVPLPRPANSCSRVGSPPLPPASAPAIAYAGCAAASWRFSSAILSSWDCSRMHSRQAVSYRLAATARMLPTSTQVERVATAFATADPAG